MLLLICTSGLAMSSIGEYLSTILETQMKTHMVRNISFLGSLFVMRLLSFTPGFKRDAPLGRETKSRKKKKTQNKINKKHIQH